MLCQVCKLGLIGRKRVRCKEAAAKTGSVDPLSRCDAADGPFATNPTGGGQGAVGFGARRQCMSPYTFLLASRPQPPGPPSISTCRLDRALAAFPLPAGLILLPLIRSAGSDPAHQASAVAGWMLLMMVVQSVSAIMAGTLCRGFRSCFLAGIISALAVLISEMPGCAAGLIPAAVMLPTGAVFITWGLFCAGLAKQLSVWGGGPAVTAAITLAVMLLFSPVIATPPLVLVQHLQLHGSWLTDITVNISPALWMINALSTGMRYNWFIWFHAPLMYQHVVVGQNILMPKLCPWWLACTAAGVAGLVLMAGRIRRRAPDITGK